jgi:ankyrin repeat protein
VLTILLYFGLHNLFAEKNPLIKAIQKFEYNKIEILLQENNNHFINIPDEAENRTVIFFAIVHRFVDYQKYLPNNAKESFDQRNLRFKNNKELLLKAINTLIQKGANLNHLDKNGVSPLLLALRYKDSVVINILLKNKVSIDSSYEAFILASKNGNEEIVSFYLNKKFEPCQYVHTEGLFYRPELSAIHHTIVFNKENTFNLLIERTPNVDCKSATINGYLSNLTPMQITCIYGRDNVFNTLLTKGASLAIKMNDGKNLLHLASMGSRFEISSIDKKGKPQGNLIIPGGNLKLVQYLISSKNEFDTKDLIGANPLQWACYYRKIDIAIELIKSGQKPLNLNLNCEHSFGSALANILFQIFDEKTVLDSNKIVENRKLILKAKEMYQDSLSQINKKLLGRVLLNATISALADVSANYQASMYSNVYGYGYSQVEYPTIKNDDLNSIKKYIAAQVAICDDILALLKSVELTSSKTTFFNSLIERMDWQKHFTEKD